MDINKETFISMDQAAAAKIISALDSRLRIQIVLLLAEHERYVHEIVKVTRKSQPLISQHLRVLKTAELVDSERRGREVVYRLIEPKALEILLIAASAGKSTATGFPATSSPESAWATVTSIDSHQSLHSLDDGASSDKGRSSAASGPAYAPAAAVPPSAVPPTIPAPIRTMSDQTSPVCPE
ncbi:ArsR/SmtB family transcription factor [Corynebacterium spheniscorum]|nr:metalloregulator ArsR/SmtB family transcription factor [Corynebacterium spheniscorum]KAA8719413.1 winged helix-turn-helix transcriptional regulator [Corynebacterium spheniscorum]